MPSIWTETKISTWNNTEYGLQLRQQINEDSKSFYYLQSSFM